MGGGEGLGNGGHAHGVGPQKAGRPDFRRGLKLRAGEEHIGPLVDPERRTFGAVQGQLPQLRGVHPGHVEEPGAEILHIGPPEGAVPVQLDMVPNDHHVPGAVVPVDGPGGVGENGGPDSQQLQNPDGDDQLLEGVALVGVEAAGHADHPPARHRAENQLPGVGGHGGEQKMGDLGVIHGHRVFDGLGEGPQAGAQDNADFRGNVRFRPQKICGGLEIFIGIGHGQNHLLTV